MSAVGQAIVEGGEAYLKAARMKDTSETWDWVMDAAMAGTINLSQPPATAVERGAVIDLFDTWADAA